MASFSVKSGNVSVRVYDVTWHGRPAWEVRDHAGGRGHTHRRKFARRSRAVAYATERARLLAAGAGPVLKLHPDQAAEFDQAARLLAPTGKGILELALEERRRWQFAFTLTQKPLSEVMAEFLEGKRRAGLSELHLRDLSYRLKRLSEKFPGPMLDLTRPAVAAWLDGLKVSAVTWNNYRAAIAALTGYAKAAHYLPADWTEIETLEPIKTKRRQIVIFTASELALLLNAAPPALLPGFAVQALAGLRSSEVKRLAWSDLKFNKGFIYCREEITKTNRTRTAPIVESLAAWLAPWTDSAAGLLCSYARFESAKANLAKRLGLAWSRNILRDSYISYRLAATGDLARTALEAGNSPAMILRHYLELTTPAEAAAWFAISPGAAEQKILPLKFA